MSGPYGPDTFTVNANDGSSVQAKYLRDSQGQYVMDPILGKPLVVPLDYDPAAVQAQFERAVEQIAADLAGVYDESGTQYKVEVYRYFAEQFQAGHPSDLQRTYNGTSNGSFVAAFTNAASFNLGVAARAAGLMAVEAVVGGGLYNGLKNLGGADLNTSGELWNANNNAVYIREGHRVASTGGLDRAAPPIAPSWEPSTEPPTYLDPYTVLIKPGDTLWKIVEDQRDNHGNKISLRDLRIVNGLKPGQDLRLRPGQQILVPEKVNGNLVVDYGDVRLSLNPDDGTYMYLINNRDRNSTILITRTIDPLTGEYIDRYTETDSFGETIVDVVNGVDRLAPRGEPDPFDQDDWVIPFEEAQAVPAPRRDPIVLDLNGDGLITLGLSEGAHFDHDANGFAERTGWIGPEDGLLVWDRDGDGRISSGSELIGDMMLLPNGVRAASGAEALSALDRPELGGNGDGVVDAYDLAWSELQVWLDGNSDGFTDAGELLTLAQAGVSAFDLELVTASITDAWGNRQVRQGHFIRSDGSVAGMSEYLPVRDPFHSLMENVVALTPEILALPEVRGSGNVLDMRQAVAQDSTGLLRSLIEAFVGETDQQRRDSLLDPILFQWAGAANREPGSRGGFFDARKLAVLESFAAESFQGALGSDPTAPASILLARAYHELSELVHAALMGQTHLRDLYQSIEFTLDPTTLGMRADLSHTIAQLEQRLAEDPVQGRIVLSELARMLRGSHALHPADYDSLRSHFASQGEDLAIAFDSGGRNVISDADSTNTIHGTTGADLLAGGAGNDSITAYDGDDVIYGGEGDDVLSGCENDDQLFGGLGSDHLFGAEDNDVLDGGAGNDLLNGGAGNDVYVLALGTGQDDIIDYDTTPGNTDAIRIDFSAAALAVRIWRQGNYLYVGLEGTDDTVRVRDWFNGTANRVEEVILADGSRMTTSQLAAARFIGSSGADVMAGSTDGDYLEGLAGNDVLQGRGGNDVLDGGAGNDTLYGGSSGYSTAAGAGNDTYLFGRGYGRDVIYDYDTTPGNRDTIRLIDLAASEVTLRREGRSFVVDVNDSDDELRVVDWGSGAAYRIERIEFADGSVLEGDDLAAPFLGTAGDDTLEGTTEDDVLLGLDGDDLLKGGGGNDVLDGGAGNDTLYGGDSGYTSSAGAGSDTYIFARGYGRDVIYDYDTTAGSLDIIRLKDLNAADVTLKRVDRDFVLSVNGSSDQLRVVDWGSGAAYRIERIELADGSVLEGEDLAAPFLGTAGNDTLTGTAEDDVLLGLDGDDLLKGGSGNDVLDGGAGNDTLYGGDSGYTAYAGAGSDAYVFARGYGRDVIYDYDTTAGSLDIIRLKDLNAADVTLKRVGRDFVLSVNGSSDELRVVDWGSGAAYRIERIELADGSVLEGEDLVAPFLGTAGDDDLTGTTDDDVLLGLGGNDVLRGVGGGDVLDGGAGNDTLYGGDSGYTSFAGGDVYVFGRGYGLDVIYDYDTTAGSNDTVRLKDLNAADVTIKRVGSTFVIDVNDSADELRVSDWGSGQAYRIERIEFADGSVLEGEDLVAPFLGTANGDTLTGTAEDDVLLGLGGIDVLKGGAGNDKLDGGAGNDTLYGGDSGNTSFAGAGSDTYIFGRGYGLDVIYDHDSTAGSIDTIELKDLNAADVTIKRDNGSFYIAVNGSSDQIRVADWSLGAIARIERVKFADGSVLEGAALAATPFIGTESSDTLNGTAENDVLRGLGGTDTLTGAGGDDVLDGGAGNDALRGGIGGYTAKSGAGNDTYLFGRGYGVDTVYDFDDTPGNLDTIRLLDLNAADVTIRRNASTFFIDLNGTSDQIKVNDWGAGAAYRIERVEFADGSALSAAELARVPYLGGTGGDSFIGTAENELMYGLGGNDTLNGMAGDDLIDGGDGTDIVNGGEGNDVVLGGAGNDTLNGGAGGDFLDGGTGADRMSGNAGDDVFRVDNTGDQALESSNEGNDTVLATLSYTLADKPNLENVTLEGSADLNATGNAVANVLTGNAGANVLAGGAGNDTLRGAAGNDRLDGGSGNDVLDGGAGDDTYVFARGYGQDRASESGSGAGYDTVQFLAGVLPADVTVSTSGGSLVLAINGTADALTLEHWYDDAARIERVAFDNGTQWTWEALRAQLNRGPQLVAAPDDVLVDEDSSLFLVPGAGVFTEQDPDDRIALALTLADGSALPEWLSFDAATGALTGTPGNGEVGQLALRLTGTDLYGASGAAQFGLTVRNVNDAPELAGSIPDQVASEGSEFVLAVDAGLFADADDGDTLTLAASVDGAGLPAWLSFDAHAARFLGTPGNEDAGSWRVTLTATDAAGAFAASEFLLTVAPSAGIQLGGSPESEVLSGSTGGDVIAGAEGADTLYGGGGADTLDGGPGADRLDGGSGDDWLHFAPDDLWIAPWSPPDRSDADAYARWERLFQAFFRNRSLDFYAGGSGIDTLLGTDSGDGMVLDASFYDASAPVAASFAQIEVFLAGDGDDVIDLRSPTLVYGAATLDGGAGADFLWGNAGDDLLIGGDGYDVLDGGAGADRMIGGAGGDSYFVDNVADLIIELAAEGTDTVTSSVTYTLADNVEKLVLSGVDAIDGVGNGLSNTLTGNAAANILRGDAGDDLLRGGGGADLLIGGGGDDSYHLTGGEEQIEEAAGAGRDQVFAWFDHVLGPNLEDLYLVSPLSALVGVGNDLDNRLFGNLANNLLEGGDGADRLDAGAGDDLLVGGRGDDSIDAGAGANVVLHNAGDGADRITPGGTRMTVSLGGGTAYENLALRQTGDDLVLETGAEEGVTLAGWYSAQATRPQHLSLQTITEAMAQFDASSTDELLNKKVQQFDLGQLVQEYDQARAGDPSLDRWALMNRLLDARLAASDTEAVGGDLAYQYGTAGSIAGIGLTPAQQVLNTTAFGAQAQALRPLSELEAGAVRLT